MFLLTWGNLSFSSYGDILLYSDERLLAQVGFHEIQPVDLSPMPEPGSTLVRRSSTVTLDIMGILQTIEKIGGLRLTQSGNLRTNIDARVGAGRVSNLTPHNHT